MTNDWKSMIVLLQLNNRSALKILIPGKPYAASQTKTGTWFKTKSLCYVKNLKHYALII